MAEIIGLLAVGFALGAVICGPIAYDQGFKAGFSWARNKWSGLT